MATAHTHRTSNATGLVRALGYLRVSTEGQAESGAGLDAQRTAIEAEASQQGWQLEVVTDTSSGTHLNRPALAAALDRLDRGDADLLLAAKLDRVSRSVKDFTELLERAHREGWRLVLLDLGDTSTATGELTANMIATNGCTSPRVPNVRIRTFTGSLPYFYWRVRGWRRHVD